MKNAPNYPVSYEGMREFDIMKALSDTKSDDFSHSGSSFGLEVHATVMALAACNDRLLVLSALQVAFALGRKSVCGGMEEISSGAEWNIKYLVQRHEEK